MASAQTTYAERWTARQVRAAASEAASRPRAAPVSGDHQQPVGRERAEAERERAVAGRERHERAGQADVDVAVEDQQRDVQGEHRERHHGGRPVGQLAQDPPVAALRVARAGAGGRARRG